MKRIALLVLLASALAAQPAGAATGTWQRLHEGPGGPDARADAALVAPNARTAYLHGGERNGTNSLDDFWRFDVKRKRWTQLRPEGDKPAARFGHDLVAAKDGSLLLFGGQSGDDFFGDLWRYDPKANRWTLIDATGPAPRYGAGVAQDRARDTFFVTHGFTNDGRFDDTWSFGGARFADLSAPADARPRKRCLVGAAYYKGGVFMFGGQSDEAPFMRDLWRYDASARTWAELKPRKKPSARNRYGSALLGRRWVIHGGATRTGVASDVWLVDLAKPATFTRVRTRGTTLGPRANQAMTALSSSRALVFGGQTNEGEQRGTWLLRLR